MKQFHIEHAFQYSSEMFCGKKVEKEEWIFDLSSLFYWLEDCWEFGLI